MSLTARIFCVVISIIFAGYIINKTRKKLFSEKDSIVWVLFSLMVIILSVFPGIVSALSMLAGIQYPPSFIFIIGFLFVIVVIFHMNQSISLLTERCKELAQENAMLDFRIRELEKKQKSGGPENTH